VEPAPPAARRFPHLRGDLMGGVSAAILTIPVSIGYGILALAPLGPDYIAHGVLAGLYAVVCGGLTALLLGANTTMVYARRNHYLPDRVARLQTFVLSAHEALGSVDSHSLLALVFLLIFLAGLMQAAFGSCALATS